MTWHLGPLFSLASLRSRTRPLTLRPQLPPLKMAGVRCRVNELNAPKQCLPQQGQTHQNLPDHMEMGVGAGIISMGKGRLSGTRN